MTTVIVLISVTIVLCLAGFVGGALLLVGFLTKRRRMSRAGTIVLVSTLLGLTGSFTYLSVRVFSKLKDASPKHYWQALVDAAFDDTAIRPLDPTKAKQVLSGSLTNTAFLSGVDVQGVWVQGAVLSYGYFLYSADEKDVLSAVASAPTNSSFQFPSDTACRGVTWAECKQKLLYPKGPQRNLPGWAPEAVVEKRCYSCLRCPWLHTILIDGKTGKVYHAISEIRE
jgi:hypothetical protein